MIVLSYLWILCLIPLLTKKDDPEVQWHAKNGLALLGAEIVCWIVFTILGIFVPASRLLAAALASFSASSGSASSSSASSAS